MLRFQVFDNGKPAGKADLSGAYLMGSDGVPLRAEIDFKNGEIVCKKRTAGPAGLVMLWPVNGGAKMLCETTRLPERDKPYILEVELLRGRLMRLAQKREDWGLHEFEGTEEISKQIDACRDLLIKSLQADTATEAATIAARGIALGLAAAEQLTTFHAEIFFNRRKQVGGFPRRLFGVRVDPFCTDEAYRERIASAFDYIAVPFSWRHIEPKEQEHQFKHLDSWVEWATKRRIPVRATNLVSFTEADTPDWLYIWEHDFEAIRDLVYEHIRRVIGRYGQYIQVWEVISGIHAVNTFSFNFEQLMELSRMSAAITKQLAPRASAVIDVVTPWGEYYASNQRTIPPMLYAEMLVQSGVQFDAFGLQFYFGVGVDGMFVRDLFQVSAMIDRFAALGKPVHITGLAVPSDIRVDQQDAWTGAKSVSAAGAWHKGWTEEIQRAWLRRVYHIALSKPFVEAVTWRDLCEKQPHFLPHGGLLRADGSPKPAFEELLAIRDEIAPQRDTPAAAGVR